MENGRFILVRLACFCLQLIIFRLNNLPATVGVTCIQISYFSITKRNDIC
uniref:Uncharacterized protein n=1 Tax=Arundo donax TaxID=35708 RepID=A0A0A9HDX2_ARUDO